MFSATSKNKDATEGAFKIKLSQCNFKVKIIILYRTDVYFWRVKFFFFVYFLSLTKRSISTLSQVGLFNFSSNKWEAALINRSLSTLAQDADRYVA